ncbi:MAG: DUF6076 domain-containing protein [Hydrogenoanaerobacterium sp.]
MFYVPQLPCYKIYKKANHAMQIVWFESEISTGHFSQDCVGDFLIEFLEMDLTKYAKALRQFGESTKFHTQLLFDLGYLKIKEMLLATADLLSDNLHMHRLLVGTMKKFFEDKALSDIEQLEKAYLELLYIVQMYNQFSNALVFCLDPDNYTEIGITQKFAGFIQSSARFRNYRFQTGYGVAPVDKHGNLDYGTVQKLNAANADLETQLDAVKNAQGGVSLLPFTWILSFEDLLFYDFLELVSRGLPVKRCKLCGKFFVQKTRHKTEYCDRKTENGRTCKQVGPKIVFNTELAKPENATLKEYDRIRKMKQQKLERDRNKETGRAVGKAQAVYDAWSEKAAELREKFVRGEIPEEELLRELISVS